MNFFNTDRFQRMSKLTKFIHAALHAELEAHFLVYIGGICCLVPSLLSHTCSPKIQCIANSEDCDGKLKIAIICLLLSSSYLVVDFYSSRFRYSPSLESFLVSFPQSCRLKMSICHDQDY